MQISLTEYGRAMTLLCRAQLTDEERRLCTFITSKCFGHNEECDRKVYEDFLRILRRYP